MSYFVREDTRRKQSPPRRHGKHVGAAKEIPVPPKDLPTRDSVIEANIAAMQRDSDGKSGAGVLRYVSQQEVKNPQRNSHHRPDSDIFGPPTEQPKRTPRVRTGVSDEELRKIWAEDDRKAAAASRMMAAPTMVEKMVAEPVNPVFTDHKGKDAQAGPRKHIDLLTATQADRNRTANEPAGFAGMGRQSGPAPRAGRSTQQQPVPGEEREVAARKVGRRTKFPENTFSFQDDNQTHIPPSSH